MTDHENKRRRRGPIAKTDKLEPEAAAVESASPESSGAEAASVEQKPEPEPESNSSVKTESLTESSDQPPRGETPAMRELQERVEAKAATEPDKGPHPYLFQVNDPAAIPMAMRDPMTGEASRALIDEHLTQCWRIGTTPQVAGVLISEKKLRS